MAEVTAGELLIRIKADAKKLEDALKTSGSSVNTFSQKVESVSKKLTTTGMKMSLAITAPLTLIGKKALDSAMDVVESENLFEVSMGNMAEAARKWSEEFADSVGLNEYNVRKQVGTFNVMLTSMGLTEDAALDMSEKMTQLAYDMASFYNLEVEDAFIKIQGGITGEAESLKRLGIIVNETAVKQTAYKNGITEVGTELTENEKILARYQTIMEATSKAQGDMARTLDSPANQMRVFKEQIQLAMIELGKGLIPIMQEVIKNVKPLVEWFTNLNDTQKEWIVKLGVLAASTGPLVMATGQVLNFTSAIKKSSDAMKASLLFSGGASAPLFGIIGGVINLGTAAYGLTDAIKGLKDGSMGWREALIKIAYPMVVVLEKIEFFKKLLPEWWGQTDKATESTKTLSREMFEMKNAGRAFVESMKGVEDEAEDATQAIDDLTASLFELFNINQSVDEAAKEYQETIKEYPNDIYKQQDALENYMQVLEDSIESEKTSVLEKSILIEKYKELGNAAVENGQIQRDEFEEVVTDMKKNVDSVYIPTLSTAVQMTGNLKKSIDELEDKEITITTNFQYKGQPWQETGGAQRQAGKQTGGEVVNTGIIPDLDVIGIKGEWLLNKQLVNAIKTSRTDSMGITAGGGKTGGDVYLNVTIPGMVIREDADIKKLTQSFYDEIKIKSLGAGIKW